MSDKDSRLLSYDFNHYDEYSMIAPSLLSTYGL